MQFSHQMHSPASSFSSMATNHFFLFSSYFSSSSSSFHILFNSPTSIFSLQNPAFPSFPNKLLFSSQILSSKTLFLSQTQWHPSLRKAPT